MDNFFISPTLVHTAGNLKSSSYLRVYPNPVSRILQLKLAPESGLYKIDQISLFNSTGQKILERFNLDLENNISLEPYEPGVYQLDVITNGKKEHFSFIISPH